MFSLLNMFIGQERKKKTKHLFILGLLSPICHIEDKRHVFVWAGKFAKFQSAEWMAAPSESDANLILISRPNSSVWAKDE